MTGQKKKADLAVVFGNREREPAERAELFEAETQVVGRDEVLL